MVISGVCEQDGERGEYVVKLKGSPEMYPGASLKEMISSFIALELNLPIPEPAIINITKELVETMNDHGNFQLAKNSTGINFGSVYKSGFSEILPGQPIDQNIKEALLDLFAFDVFISNPDRRTDKNNFQTNGKDLLIFDHEMAFSFIRIFSFARNPQPWLILAEDLEWLKYNFCFHNLKGSNFDFSNFTDA